MSYNQHTSDHNEPGSKMTPEEIFVREALKDYREETNYRLWCAVEDLYRVYKGKWLSRDRAYPGDEDPVLLNKQQFGAALNAVFPNAFKVVRRINNVRKRGRACLNGPVAHEMRKAGRPHKGN